MTCRRLPCAFFGHGGGPLPLMGQQTEVAATLSSYASTLEAAPSAILIISAHWIADVVSIGSGETHSLLFDYSGFPPETYTYTYPAPGSPDLACRVAELLSAYGVPTRLDPSRGWDHGTFVPLKLMFPHADVPVVALSLHSSLDPDLHINMGRALAPLRSEGVFIIGSGMSFHNFAYFFTRDSAIKALGVQHSYQFNNQNAGHWKPVEGGSNISNVSVDECAIGEGGPPYSPGGAFHSSSRCVRSSKHGARRVQTRRVLCNGQNDHSSIQFRVEAD
jgi:aromatic ring-opening dioxygenase catalytic subunit (LigB family)